MLQRPIELAQYTSVAFTAELLQHDMHGSIGTVGDALDNALCESTIGLFKTEAINDGGPTWADRRAVEVIQSQTRRLERIVADLLDASWLDVGRLELRRARVDLVTLARSAAEQAEMLGTEHSVRVDLPDSVLEGAWDQDRLGQVLTNLLNNAVKYSPSGGEIRLRVEDLVFGSEAMLSLLELAAQGRREASAETLADPDLAPLHAGAERLADRMVELVGDLAISGRAAKTLAAEVLRCARQLGTDKVAQVEAADQLANSLTALQPAATRQAQGGADLARKARSGARLSSKARGEIERARAAAEAARRDGEPPAPPRRSRRADPSRGSSCGSSACRGPCLG